MLPLHGFFLEEYLHHYPSPWQNPPYTLPYITIMYYCYLYRVYLPFYRVKNPISPSLSWVFRLTPSYPTPTIAWPLPRRYHCSMNIGAGDPTRPIPPSLDVIDNIDYFVIFIFYNLFICILVCSMCLFPDVRFHSTAIRSVLTDSSLLATSCGRPQQPQQP